MELLATLLFWSVPLTIAGLWGYALVRGISNSIASFVVLNSSSSARENSQVSKSRYASYREDNRYTPASESESAASPHIEEKIFGYRRNEPIDELKLKKKYHELLKLNHPDLIQDRGEVSIKQATEQMKNINWAYQTLRSRALHSKKN